MNSSGKFAVRFQIPLVLMMLALMAMMTAGGRVRAEQSSQGGESKFGDDTVVYSEPGSKRGHIDGCRRLTSDATERERLKTTLGVMKEGGGELCSRCPGRELNQEREQAGSKKPATNKPASKGLPESWVKPAPDVVPKHPYEINPLEPLVALGSDGRLVYRDFSKKGDQIPDFSMAGYMRSEEPIPNVPAVETLQPPKGDAEPQANMKYPVGTDNHAVIQAALDRVAALPAAKDGYRGAVVLGKGTWFLKNGLLLRSGVVLRGKGDGEDGTVLVFTMPSGQGVGILLGDVADAGTTESISVMLTGVLGERTLPNGNEGFVVVLDDGRELATRTGDIAGELAANVGKRVTLEYIGIVNTQGGRRRVTLKHTKPSRLEVLAADAAAPALDPDLVLPESEPAAGTTTEVKIADSNVPTGATRFRVADASGFSAGDLINIQKTTNARWIDVLGVGERLRHIRGGEDGLSKKPWGPQSFGHIRTVTAVEGDTLMFDIPLPQSIATEHGGGTVSKLTGPAPDSKIGVESLRIVSNYDTTVEDTGKDANFRNLESGITVGAADSWVRNCTVLHVWQSAVRMEDAHRITVRDCRSLEPVGPSRGGRRYTFSINGSAGVLVYRCFAEDGRHDFVVGARTSGPNAFVECSALRGEQSEPHHRWGSGTLYDNIRMNEGGSLAAINRGDSGSGHGWAAANTVFWNCAANTIVVADPETEGENNFAIGFKGEAREEYETGGVAYANTRAGYWGTPQEGKYYGYALMGNGYIQSPSAAATPDSLFIQQLIDRIGKDEATRVLEGSHAVQEARR